MGGVSDELQDKVTLATDALKKVHPEDSFQRALFLHLIDALAEAHKRIKALETKVATPVVPGQELRPTE